MAFLSTDDAKALTRDDYIIVDTMYNVSLPIGTLSSTGTTSFDTNTLYGQLERIVSAYVNSECKARFAMLLGHANANFNATQQAERRAKHDAAINVCTKYGVSYIDLFDKALTGQYEVGGSAAVLPTAAGSEAIAKDVEIWIKTIPAKSAITPTNQLNLIGKKLVVFGTSISYGQGASTNYGKEIADRNKMTFTNYAEGGASAIRTYNIYESKKSSMTELTADDIVIFEGLFNNREQKLGQLTPVGTTTFDTSIVYGALEQTIYNFKKSGCPAKVGYILTHYSQLGHESPELFDPIWQAGVDVCQKYNIPLLDLSSKNYELVSDGVHLSTAGQLGMSQDVEAWLKTL